MTVKLASVGVGTNDTGVAIHVKIGASLFCGKWYESVECDYRSPDPDLEDGGTRKVREFVRAMDKDAEYRHPAEIVAAYRERYKNRDYAETEVAPWFAENGGGAK